MLLSFFFSKTIGEPWKLDITFLVLKYWHHNITSLLLLKTNHWKKLFDNQFLYFLSSNSSLNPWNMNSIPRFNLESNCYFFCHYIKHSLAQQTDGYLLYLQDLYFVSRIIHLCKLIHSPDSKFLVFLFAGF